MGKADRVAQETRSAHSLVTRQVLDVELEILRQQFAQEDRCVLDPPGHHAVAERRRQVPGTGDDALAVVARHVGVGIARGDGLGRFLDVDQAQLAAADGNQNGIAQLAERAAALDPVGGVQDFERGVIVAAAQGRHHAPHFFVGE